MRITGERAVKENKYDDEVFFNKYKEMSRLVYGLKGAGEHPVFTAYGSQDWYYDDQGNILHFPVDNYYYEGKRVFHTPRGGAPAAGGYDGSSGHAG